MRHILTLLAGTLLAGISCTAATSADGKNTGEKIDLSTTQGALDAMRKVQCSLVDGEETTYYWHGRAFSRKMGERDVHLFNVSGMNIRACVEHTDEKRGKGFKLVTRELLIYLDKETGQPIKTWDNPWTGETVEVMHVANDPVNNGFYEKGRDGKPASFAGEVMNERWQMSFTVPLYYPNPLASEYQNEIGGVYHATEMFNFMGQVDDLVDRSKNSASVAVGWARMSDWLPWMKMSGREGVIYMHTAGRKLERFDDLPDVLKTEIKTHYPKYDSAPPLDDTRKNMTSWKYYQAVKEGTEVLPKR